MLREYESIDDLHLKGLKIIQHHRKFKFGIDAVLLSNFATVKPGSHVLDLGTGTGILPILLCGKTEAKHITAIELQADMAEMAQRSCRLNGLEQRITVIEGDLREIERCVTLGTMDTVLANPPYKKQGSGLVSQNQTIAIAKSEIACTLEDVVGAADNCLKMGGNFAMVHRPERLADIMTALRRHHMEPKRLKTVYARLDQPPVLLLVEAVKGGGTFLKWEEPFIVGDQEGQNTDVINAQDACDVSLC